MPPDILVVEFPHLFCRNSDQLKLLARNIGIERFGQYFLLPNQSNEWKVYWVSGKDATDVILFLKQQCPWIMLPANQHGFVISL